MYHSIQDALFGSSPVLQQQALAGSRFWGFSEECGALLMRLWGWTAAGLLVMLPLCLFAELPFFFMRLLKRLRA